MFTCGIEEGKLKNGARYALAHVPGARFSETNLSIEVGGFDEKADEIGIAHFLEHALIAHTPMFNDKQLNSYFKTQQQVGSGLYTTPDNIVCHFGGLRPRCDKYFEYVKNYMNPTKFQSDLVNREKGIITSEINRQETDFQRAAMYHALQARFGKNARIAQGNLGSKQTIFNMTPEKLYQFYTDHFRADKVVFTIVGDIDKNLVLDNLEDLTECLPKGPSLERKPFLGNVGYQNKYVSYPKVITNISFLDKDSNYEEDYHSGVMYRTLYESLYTKARNTGDHYHLDYSTIAYKGFSIRNIGFVAEPKKAVDDTKIIIDNIADFPNYNIAERVEASKNAQEHNQAYDDENYLWRAERMNDQIRWYGRVIDDAETKKVQDSISVERILEDFKNVGIENSCVTFYGDVADANLPKDNNWIAERLKI